MRRVVLVAAAIAVVGCSQSADPTTTTPILPPPTTETTGSTSTTVPSTTTSTVATTTTTTTNPGEIVYPDAPATVDDLPEVLTAHIGAPMPQPDLAISGPADLDRWMTGWLNWLGWAHANPTEGSEQLGVNMIPGSEQFEDIRSALIQRAEDEQLLLGGGFVPVSVSGTFDEFFDDKTLLMVVVVAEGPSSYLVEQDGAVTSVFEGIDGEVTLSALLRHDPERNEWLMETFEVLGRS